MKKLSGGQIAVLIAATLPMIGAGAAGGIGTYANITSVFHRSATALGVVAAGEGATLVLALVNVGLTMLGQASPLPVRAGLWLVPLTAAVTGVIVAPGTRDAVVFAITPMAMTVSAEGLGLLARRIVVYRTDTDVEAQRRNATLLRQIAYHQARAERHPKGWVRKRSALKAWRLASRIGDGDAQLGAGLVAVQRGRITDGASAALGYMLVGVAAQSALDASDGDGFEETVDTALTVTAAAQSEVQPVAQPQPTDGGESAQPQVQPQPEPDVQPEVQPQDDDGDAQSSNKSERKVTRMRTPEEWAQLLDQARAVNAQCLQDSRKKASLRVLQRELGIGQRTAQLLQPQLPDTLATADAKAPTDTKEA
ncbi:hypothetical protein [Streptomyces sp. YIM S03343]